MSENEQANFHVFGRKAYPEPLAYVKTVSADEVETAAGDDEEWVELIAFPETAAIQVIPWQKRDTNDR